MTKEATKVVFIVVGSIAAALGLVSILGFFFFDAAIIMLLVGAALILLGLYTFYSVATGNYRAIRLKEEKPKYSEW
jgi:cytochrome c biogenesis protein ResB